MAERIAPPRGAHTRPAASPRRQFRWVRPAAVAVAGVVLFLCYVRLSGTFPVGSDGASNSLEAWDMLHGNWLLHGWLLTDVSFYTTELPEYVLVELARGLSPAVVHITPAITYTLLVLPGRPARQGHGSRARGMGPGADRGRDHDRAAARQRRSRAVLPAGSRRHPGADPGDLPGARPGTHAGGTRRAEIGVLLALVVLADEVAILNAAVPLAVACALRAA